ncbi:hypothetical protein ACO0LL_10345 [Undibacterium sp. TC4M20W]|uniref:hypothetical protein n=1 Tax=unclassified Undibacterium TaxID=2630295 RepID=UPI003BF0CE76
MIIVKSVGKGILRATVRLETVEYGNGWTLGVEINGIMVHHPDKDLYQTEQDALIAGDEVVDAMVPTLH